MGQTAHGWVNGPEPVSFPVVSGSLMGVNDTLIIKGSQLTEDTVSHWRRFDGLQWEADLCVQSCLWNVRCWTTLPGIRPEALLTVCPGGSLQRLFVASQSKKLEMTKLRGTVKNDVTSMPG